MDIRCPRCGSLAVPAGHEDARAFHQCEKCNRVWTTAIAAGISSHAGTASTHVLVVDDSEQLVALVSAWLEDEGYTVSTAMSGARALEAIASHAPDIILLDLIIPAPDGFAVCQALRRHSNPPQIILITGVSDPLRLRLTDDLGVFALLRKPVTEESVLDVVSRAQRHRRGNRREAVTSV
jgi:CheY-like chemotaxis protein